MTRARRKLPRGWKEGGVREFLDLSAEDMAIIEIKARLAREVRKRRKAKRLSQASLAERVSTTQSRIARIEAAEASIEMLIRSLLALGESRSRIARLLAA